jgi:hypothetical protein
MCGHTLSVSSVCRHTMSVSKMCRHTVRQQTVSPHRVRQQNVSPHSTPVECVATQSPSVDCVATQCPSEHCVATQCPSVETLSSSHVAPCDRAMVAQAPSSVSIHTLVSTLSHHPLTSGNVQDILCHRHQVPSCDKQFPSDSLLELTWTRD